MIITKLVAGNSYGTKAKDAYLLCCDAFGWDKGLAKEFGMMKPLYGHRAADNGTKDVWFICKCNWYNDVLITVIENGKVVEKHRNYIYPDLSHIEEYQINAQNDDYPLRDRITFAKNKNGQYVFLGVYRAKEPNSRNPSRLFFKISDNYSVSGK